MTFKKIITLSVALAALSTPAYSVTKEEMERARVIAAQCYLRYANNGSGYLDEIDPASMSDLEKKLKKKETENLRAFKAVKLPSDYSAWDKEKLVAYWSGTFLNSPGLLAEGKAARSRIRSKLSAMTVSVPSADSQKPKADEGTAVSEASAENAAKAVEEEVRLVDSVENVAVQDSQSSPDIDVVPKTEGDSSATWIYVAILVVLVGVVLWLVIYASKTMGSKSPKQRGGETSPSADSEEMSRMEADLNNALIAKNNEIRNMRVKLERYESSWQELSETNRLLKQEKEQLLSRISQLEKKLVDSDLRVRDAENRVRSESAATVRPSAGSGRTIFLGRVNSKGIFVRADREFNPANDVYRLITHDGITGAFEIVDDRDLSDLISSSAEVLLGNGCEGVDFRRMDAADRIVTTTPGVAVFENGYWCVSRKARVERE